MSHPTPALPSSLPGAGLVCFWDFAETAGSPRVSRGPAAYALREGGRAIARVPDGIFGPHAAALQHGDYFFIPRAECPELHLTREVSVVAWVQRDRKPEVQCEAIAGCWNETRRQRQYALFLDLRIHQSGDNVSGHVSRAGGPTPGYPWSMDAAIGRQYVDYFSWHCVAMTYDGEAARVYLDGTLDARPGFNPYAYPGPLHDGGAEGADFTVGAVHRGGEMGNWFTGRLGGLAVYRRALAAPEIQTLAGALPGGPRAPLTLPPQSS